MENEKRGLSLSIRIVGAGIAGLATAATLARLGHHVDVSYTSALGNACPEAGNHMFDGRTVYFL
jgi:thioredoxin reductase